MGYRAVWGALWRFTIEFISTSEENMGFFSPSHSQRIDRSEAIHSLSDRTSGRQRRPSICNATRGRQKAGLRRKQAVEMKGSTLVNKSLHNIASRGHVHHSRVSF